MDKRTEVLETRYKKVLDEKKFSFFGLGLFFLYIKITMGLPAKRETSGKDLFRRRTYGMTKNINLKKIWILTLIKINRWGRMNVFCSCNPRKEKQYMEYPKIWDFLPAISFEPQYFVSVE